MAKDNVTNMNNQRNGKKRNTESTDDEESSERKRTHLNFDSDKLTVLDPLKLPSYYKKSTLTKSEKDKVKNENGVQRLADLLIRNAALMDELFHLRNFTSLVYFDPNKVTKIRNSDSFEKFAKKYTLWPEIKETNAGRRVSSRILEHSDPLRLEIHKALERKSLHDSQDNEKKQVKLDPTSERQKRHKIHTISVKRHPFTQPNKNIRKESVKKEPTKIREPLVVKEEAQYSESSEISDLSESSDEDSEDYIITLPDNYHYPHSIKFKYDVKPPVITHPKLLAHPKFNSLDKYLDSFVSTMEDPAKDLVPTEYEVYLQEKSNLVNRIKEGLNRKVLRLDWKENVFRNVPSGTREPTMIKKNIRHSMNHYREKISPFRMKNELTHYDYLLAQGMVSSKLIHQSRVAKLQRGRKISQIVENHFRRLSQEKERNEREFFRKKLKLAKDTAREVKKKWLIAVKAYKILEEREQEKIRAEQSKKELSKILDQSTKVLGAQLERQSSTEPTNDDDYFSSSSSDYESSDDNLSMKEKSTEKLNDNELSVDELRAKYKDITNSSSDLISVNRNDSPELASLYNGSGRSAQNSDVDYDLTNLHSRDDYEGERGLESLVTEKLDNIEDDDDDASVYSEQGSETSTSSPEGLPSKGSVASIPDVPIPSILRGTLRPYQKEGLNWLASLYNNGTNGILADEMGLGKTIQTIALLAYLACEKNEWGPHLIVVPTSVILNWEMEFKRFAPGFKVLTYYGSPQQRKQKRKGWNTPDTFHVCITSYQLVVQDHAVFRRKKWQYMILDEAHNIKNFRSQRWRSLLNFNTEHRLLLTGTPLQNNIIELWSLLYFLMPSSKGNKSMPEGFADLMNFQQWFGKPIDKIIQGGGLGSDQETRATIDKLHQVLRPYLLRRLKRDVEKQLPAKYEHVVYCKLSKRQRLLYDDFMSRAQTKETLANGNFLSIINCLMQLRKVCNHPDLFEVRPINTSFAIQKSIASKFLLREATIKKKFTETPFGRLDLKFMNLLPSDTSDMSSTITECISKYSASQIFANEIDDMQVKFGSESAEPNFADLTAYYKWLMNKKDYKLLERTRHIKYINDHNCNINQMITSDLLKAVTVKRFPEKSKDLLRDLRIVKSIDIRAQELTPIIQNYAFITPKVVCEDLNEILIDPLLRYRVEYEAQNELISNPFHQVQIKESIAFPDKSLLQYDCGKLQKLAILLKDIIPKGHRVLIFTQMAKVLNILEKFLNYNGYTYLRLDGATKIEDRQLMTERFNRDNRINCFILSTRSGGLGINLTGADTVVFYDSDWNPAMDKQCQDRCHRIGQTRDVHIYRFVSEYTIESNILKKANQKRQLDNVVIQEGDFTTDYFSKITINDLLGKTDDGQSEDNGDHRAILGSVKNNDLNKALEQAEDAEDAAAAKAALKETNVDANDFNEDRNGSRESSTTPSSEAKQSAEMATMFEVKDRKKMTQEDSDEDISDSDDEGIGHIDEYMIRFISGGFYELD